MALAGIRPSRAGDRNRFEGRDGGEAASPPATYKWTNMFFSRGIRYRPEVPRGIHDLDVRCHSLVLGSVKTRHVQFLATMNGHA